MEKPRRVVCRICLEECVDFKAIEDHMRDVLDILLLKINLAVSEEPVTCANCAAMLMRCFDFKATCFYTHDFIVPFLDDEKISKLDLRKVYTSKHQNVDIPDDHGVCGFCMDLAKRCAAVFLDNEERDVMLEKSIEKCLPELDFSTVQEPMICAPCYGSLKTCFHFVTSCLIVEERIMEYCKSTGAEVIEIADVLQWISENDIIRTKGENAVGHENASFVHVEEQRLLLNENIEINDQHDFDRCLGDVVMKQQFQQVTTKLRGKRECSESKGGPLKTSKKHKLADDVSKATMYQCGSCSFHAKNKWSLRNHMVIHKRPSETTMYQCDSCEFKTKRKNCLNGHMIIHKLPSEITMYRCDSCDFKTKYKHCIQNHMVTHKLPSEATVHQCDSCDFKTIHRNSLQKHMITHKLPSETTMYQCDSCGFKTKHKNCLNGHMIIHKLPSEITMYRCDSCDFKTKYKHCIQNHMVTHKLPSEATVHQCDSCDFKTVHISSLRRHVVTHNPPSETMMYQCESCDFKAKRKDHLKRHMLTHKDPSEITMYQCESCDFKAKRKDHLKKHMLTHKDPSETTMYQCDLST